jgi:hypothetical protein
MCWTVSLTRIISNSSFYDCEFSGLKYKSQIIYGLTQNLSSDKKNGGTVFVDVDFSG